MGTQVKFLGFVLDSARKEFRVPMKKVSRARIMLEELAAQALTNRLVQV